VISAGNDIVALQAVDVQRTQLPAFYSKFITPTELSLHKPDEITLVNFVWLLWSAKESAYKYLKRYNPELVFAPIKLVVQQLKASDNSYRNYIGEVSDGNVVLPFITTLNKDYIATIIDQGDVSWNVKQIDATDHKSQSQAVRDLLLDDLKMPDVSIQKHPNGYPVLIKNGQKLDIAVSFAHHARYVSYSFQILQ